METLTKINTVFKGLPVADILNIQLYNPSKNYVYHTKLLYLFSTLKSFHIPPNSNSYSTIWYIYGQVFCLCCMHFANHSTFIVNQTILINNLCTSLSNNMLIVYIKTKCAMYDSDTRCHNVCLLTLIFLLYIIFKIIFYLKWVE